MQEEIKTKRGYTYKDLERITPFSARFWRREAALGRIPIVKFDQRVMILNEDLEAYLAARRQVKSGKSEARNQESLAKVSS